MYSITASLLLLCIWGVCGEFTCPRPRGYFPHPHQCKKYYVCMNNQSALQTCPDQMLFDIKKRSCFTRSKVNCGDRLQEDKIEMPVNTTDHTVDDVSVTVTLNTTLLPIDYNVTDVTSVGKSERITNTSENVTDAVVSDWTRESSQLENVTDFIPGVNTTTVPEINSTVTRMDRVTDNTRFENITVSNLNVTVTEEYGNVTVTTDEVTNSSGHENLTNVSVTSTPIPSTFKLTTKEIKTTLSDYDDDYSTEDVFVCPDAYGLFPHPTDRHKYIHCQEWYPHVLTCPANLVFDNIKKVCAWRIRRQ